MGHALNASGENKENSKKQTAKSCPPPKRNNRGVCREITELFGFDGRRLPGPQRPALGWIVWTDEHVLLSNRWFFMCKYRVY